MEVEELQKEGIDIIILNKANPPFIFSAIKEGKLLFERNKLAHEYHIIEEEEIIGMAKMLNVLKHLEDLLS